MAAAVEARWPAEAPLSGLVITRYAHGCPTRRIEVVEAGHPVPDAAGETAAERVLELARDCGPGDLLLALVSGGGSSLLSLPVASVPMADLKTATRALLASGAPIEQMNVVRKHLSRIQGGRLALEASTRGAQVLALIVSDVTGDDPSAIASGPCSPDPSTYADALEVLARWRVEVPRSVLEHLERGRQGAVEETPKPGDPRLAAVEQRVVATPRASLHAAAQAFAAAGVRPVILGDTIGGEAVEVGRVLAAIAREARTAGGLGQLPGDPVAGPALPLPVALISGGECTVTIRGASSMTGGAAEAGETPPARGGRCTECLLAAALALEDLDGVHMIAADTDGIDGSEDNAGALADPGTLARARAAGVDPRRALAGNDAWAVFAASGDLVVTGPTRTNVNDYRALLVLGAPLPAGSGGGA